MKNKILLGVCSAAALALASSAFATDAIRYSINGASWVTVQDGDGADQSTGVNGAISVQVATGGFILTISTSGFSALGSAGSPDVDLDVTGVFSSTGSLVVEYTSTDYHPVPAGSYLLHAGGSLVGGTTVNNYAFIGQNTQFAGTDPGAPSNPFVAPGVTGGGSIGPVVGLGDTTHGAFPSQSNPYSVTVVQAIHTDGAGSISDDMRLSVPDGGNTLMMLGSALSVLGFGVFRKKAVKA